MIKVVIADDQALVRGGFRKILDAEPDIEVVAEAENGHEALEAIRLRRPDVAVVDIRMPELDGIAVTRHVKDELGDGVAVLIVTTFGLDEYVYETLRAGASGFLLKDAPPDDLVEAVRLLAAGEALLAPAVTRRVIEQFARRAPAPSELTGRLAELTAREREVLELLARGRSNAEIAAALVVSDATAKTHVANVLAKLGVRDRIQAVIFAYESGVVEAGRA